MTAYHRRTPDGCPLEGSPSENWLPHFSQNRPNLASSQTGHRSGLGERVGIGRHSPFHERGSGVVLVESMSSDMAATCPSRREHLCVLALLRQLACLAELVRRHLEVTSPMRVEAVPDPLAQLCATGHHSDPLVDHADPCEVVRPDGPHPGVLEVHRRPVQVDVPERLLQRHGVAARVGRTNVTRAASFSSPTCPGSRSTHTW